MIAMPVFGGRIPAVAAEKLGELKGSGKKAVTLVVYGNRAYEEQMLGALKSVRRENEYFV